MSRYGDPTGWRYYREWAVCLGLALWEEILAWIGIIVIGVRELSLWVARRIVDFSDWLGERTRRN